MALMINTNVQSLSAQNSISRAQQDQSTAMERLTTGKRINTAADDAAGLAIANKMTSQVKGLNQAVRNANDGISMLQTAAGGLEETNNILQRMRELAVQSASGTYDQTNRDSMNAEVEQLKQELDRISETTTFNGQKILDGTKQDTKLQVGANSNETIEFDIGSVAAKDLGGTGADIVGGLGGDFDGENNAVTATNGLYSRLRTLTAADGMDINGQNVGDLSALNANTNSLQDALDTMNDNVTGVEIGVQTNYRADTAGTGVLQGNDGLRISYARLDVDDQDMANSQETIRITNTANMDEVVAQINDKSGGLLQASLDDEGRLNISSTGVTNINLTADSAINAAAATASATLGVSAIGMSNADTGVFGVDAQLTLTAEAGVDGITVTYDDVTNADVVGVSARQTAGSITGQAAMTVPAAGDISAGDVIINGVELSEFDPNNDYDNNGTAGQTTDVVGWINSHSDETGVTASIDSTNVANALTLTSKDGSEVSFNYRDTLTEAERHTIEATLLLEENNAVSTAGGSVAAIDVSSAESAQKAIDVLDEAIKEVSAIQGELGAVNNRLDFTVSNLSNVSENAAAARSRIQDADFAAESANLSRAQVLQQAGQAMLAQANSAPQQVLSLLQ